MRILLVDDEGEFVSALAERLIIRGIDTEWATTSTDAIAKVRSRPFDIAVLDLKMPKTSGLALKETLHKEAPDLKFIFLTGYGSENVFEEILKQVGEDCCLVKPVEIDALIERMNSILKGERKSS